jgi:hypothetical protein
VADLSTIHIKAPKEIHIGAKVLAAKKRMSMNLFIVELIRKEMEDSGEDPNYVREIIEEANVMRQEFPKTYKKTMTAFKKADPVTTKQFTSPDIKMCKHGSDPRFCKYAKPGKPCK